MYRKLRTNRRIRQKNGPNCGSGASKPCEQTDMCPTRNDLLALKRMVTKGRLEDSFVVGGVIGQGGFSTVRVAKDKRTNKKVAIKYVAKTASICEDDLIAEVQALRTLGRHPNISKFYGLYENEKYYMMVLEYLRGGELIDVMIRRVDEGKANYTEAELAIIILQIARAVLHCHKYRVIHRDIKPENILCSDHKSVSDASRVIDAPVKLADFGLSAIIPEDEEGLTISSGTPNYMAPERLCGKVYSFKSDIWSIGVVLYILIEGKFPFPGDDEDEITKHVLDPTFPKYEGPHFDPISESCKDFLTQCFTKDPKFRPTASQLLSHEWLSGNTTATCTIKGAVEGLRRFNVRLKFRAMICAIVARNRLSNILRALRSEQLLLRLIEYGITLEEIKELAHSFRMAAWGHVMLDKETFIETMMDYSEIPDIELATEIYNAFHNAEGLVNTRDFLLALALRIGSSGSDRLGTVFWLFDKGDKGAIDFPSYYDMIVAIVGDSLNPVQTDALEEEFREADVDGNGLIDQNEFEQLAQRNECVHSYFDRLRRLMAGRREVFLSDLDEIRARKRGWLFMRYGGLFQRWVERYLVVTDDFKLELYTKDPGEGKAVRPEIVYSLDKAVLRTLDWSIATGTSTPNLSSRAPQGLGTRKTTPPRCRLECQEGSFLLEGKTLEEMNVWVEMFEGLGLRVKRQTGNTTTITQIESPSNRHRSTGEVDPLSPKMGRPSKSLIAGTDFLFSASLLGGPGGLGSASTTGPLTGGPLRPSVSAEFRNRRGSARESLANSIVSDADPEYTEIGKQVKRSGSMRFSHNF